MNPDIELTDADDPAAREAIQRGLRAFNGEQGAVADHRPLALLVRGPGGEVAGGLWGRTGFGWLFVELLFLPAGSRGGGLGTRLMRGAEAEAVGRGCRGAWLDTFSFQARGFYVRLGYAVFGAIPDYPPGASRFFMSRRLDGAPGGGRGEGEA